MRTPVFEPQGSTGTRNPTIVKLRAARYLTAEIHHRLPAQGQVIPTPRSVRGLYSSHTSFEGYGSLFTPSSEG